MRDVNRIDTFLEDLGFYWKKHCPDWRFTQLISNIQRAHGNDLFYTEEDRFLEIVRKFFGEDNHE